METLVQFFTGCKMSPDFARQRNARALAETKVPRVTVKPVLAQADADLRRADVRRFRDDAFGGKNLQTVRGRAKPGPQRQNVPARNQTCPSK